MSVQKITKELYHCKCDRTECGYEWDVETLPLRCAKCKSRRWNRKARLSPNKGEPITFNGQTLSVAAWSQKLGVAKTTIAWRIKEGWPMEQVLSSDDWRFLVSTEK